MIYNEQRYSQLIEQIFSQHPSVQTKGFTPGAYKPGLDGMKRLDQELGSPWTQYKTIHVAGTNGKGSVSSMLAASLAAKGFKVGLYTSPHLLDFRERIKIIEGSSYSLASKDFVYAFLSSKPLDGYSFFEITTALAFSYFAQQKVDYAVIETGLGGRLDSTNIITPILSIITSIGLDHCELLGSTLEAIASEKAGIIKTGVPALIGEYNESTAPVFKCIASERGSNLSFASLNPIAFDCANCDLSGPYQSANINTVLNALSLLQLSPEAEALAHTAAITGLRGRWEIISEANPCVICDIAHNPAALEINFRRLIGLKRPLYIVYGVMADKDYRAVRELMPEEAHYWGVAPKSSRALSVGKLALVLEGLDYHCAGSVAEGAQEAIEAASKDENAIVYIGGSNFVVAEYLESIK